MQFQFDDAQWAKLKVWEAQHPCPHRPTDDKPFAGGAIGGAVTYEFTPTGIGVVMGARCACGEKIDLTDYELW
jgi:hypothetical protein